MRKETSLAYLYMLETGTLVEVISGNVSDTTENGVVLSSNLRN